MRPFPLLLLFCVVAAAQEPAAPGERATFSFVVFGDRTGGKPQGLRVLEAAVRATNRLDPDFTMTVGDLVQGYDRGQEWLAQMREYKGVMDALKRPWYPVAGNHDVYGGRGNPGGNVALYKKHFAPLYYSFDYKWGHFVVLFSDEHLSFRNPARTQNMSPEQIAWLKKDLERTKATQVYVFLHHPRWLYRGTNWPRVHEVLAKDGRVQAVFAGHIHIYRDDGVKDGVHYYTVAVTGGHASGLKTPVALHHLNHLRVTQDGYTMSVLPVGAVVGSNLAMGSEVDRLHALRGGGWLAVGDGAVCVPSQARTSRFEVQLKNPAKTPVAYELRLELPHGWTGKPAFVGGQMQAGQKIEQTFELLAPPIDGRRPWLRVHAVLHHPLRSGLVQPVHHARLVPVRVTGVDGKASRKNRVLVLDGASALRVDLPLDTETFTLECWARGEPPRGRRALISKTQQSAFGLWWSYGRPQPPYATFGFRKTGYRGIVPPKPWEYETWTHYAMTCGETWARYFVNGKKVGEFKRPGPRSRNGHPLYIGADPDGRGQATDFFRGAIDEVRLSSVERYTRDFKPKRVFSRDGQTLLLLHLDSRVERLFPDDSGRDRHAWAVGAPSLAIEPR